MYKYDSIQTCCQNIGKSAASDECVVGQQQPCPHRLLGYWVLVTNWPEPFPNIITINVKHIQFFMLATKMFETT